jgi:hypothetical protein
MVNVSNAPEGRTYFNYSWKPREGALPVTDPYSADSFFHQEDMIQTKTPFVVPNGKWVMERPNHGYSWRVGVDLDELEVFWYTDEHCMSRVLYICDKPFGYVVVRYEDMDESVCPPEPIGAKRLFHARQIHKGELGQSVPIPRLNYVRQAFAEGTKPNVINARECKRSNLGWVRLTELAEAAELSLGETVYAYWDFSGHRNSKRYQNDQDGGQLLDIVVASAKDEIEEMVPDVKSVTKQEALDLIRESVRVLWVRRGFAATVLRLVALGVEPWATLPA